VVGRPLRVVAVQGYTIHCEGGVEYTTACCIPCDKDGNEIPARVVAKTKES